MSTIRLIDHLKGTGLSNRQAADLLETGKVFYREMPTADPVRLVDPAYLSIRVSAPRSTPGRDLVVIYRDEHLAVVYKPAGLLSVPHPTRRKDPNVMQVAMKLLGSAYAVHRLDEETSGLMMVALNSTCQKRIKELLFTHDIDRAYLAVVRGKYPKDPQTVTSVFVRNRGDGKRGSAPASEEPPEGGKQATTHLTLIEGLGESASIVEAKLETGRTHQVRIHLSEGKHPVLGDSLYGGDGVSRASPRLALHAYRLGLRHPMTGETLSFEIPLADDLEVLARRLRRPAAQGRSPRAKSGRRPKRRR